MTRPDGTPVNAVFGFTNMLAKLLKEHVGTHIAVIFDAGRLTFRNRLYDAYKAHRPPPPDELIPQFALVREATEAFGVPAIELPDWEADDLIATYALATTQAGGQVTIVSSDKDLMQLIRPGVDMLDPIKQKPIGPAEVMEKFGVTPDKMVEVQALIGDSTDNVPGVPGIGPKGAAQLINEFGDLEARAGRRAGDEAVQAPRHADRARRKGPHLARAGAAARRHAAAGAGRRRWACASRTAPSSSAWLNQQGFRSTVARLGLDGACRPRSRRPTAPRRPWPASADVGLTPPPH